MGDFIRENILPLFSMVFPLVMLSQFLINTVFKMIAKPRLSIHPAGDIEIGFNRFGPTVTLFGTWRTERKDAFITNVETTVRHMDSDTVRSFEWRAFKSYTFGLRPDQENIRLEPVSAFLLKVAAPFKYHTIFVDDRFVMERIRQADDVVDTWEEFQTTYQPSSTAVSQPPLTAHDATHYEAFYKQPQIQDIAEDWRQKVYWKAGEYQLEIHVHYAPDKSKSSLYTFTLTDEDIEILKSNVKTLLFNLVGQKGRYKKVHLEYKSANV